jgi:hypothetical protein
MRTQFKLKEKSAEPVSRFIESYKSPASFTKGEKQFLELKRFIFRYKFIYIGTMLAFLLLFRYFYNLSVNYKSEVTISFNGYEIPEDNQASSKSVPDFATMQQGMNRLYNIVYSKEMFDHLIGKFDLYTHYGFDPSAAPSYSIIRRLIKDNITLYQGAARALTIQVTDKTSGEMSANIANEIASKANEMNKRYITEKIQNRIKVYSKLHDEIRGQTQADIATINLGIDKLNNVLDHFGNNKPELTDLLYSLNDISKRIGGDVDRLLTISNVNSWTLNALQDDMINNVQVLQDALPGLQESNLPGWLLYSFAVVASFFITLFLFTTAYNSRNFVKLLKA